MDLVAQHFFFLIYGVFVLSNHGSVLQCKGNVDLKSVVLMELVYYFKLYVN